MPIKVTCSCGKTLTAPDAAAGKRAKCPGCGQVITIPAPVQEAELFDVAAAASNSYGDCGTGSRGCVVGRWRAAPALPGMRRDDHRRRGQVPILRCDLRSQTQADGRQVRMPGLKQLAQYQKGSHLSARRDSVQIVAGITLGSSRRTGPRPWNAAGLALLAAGSFLDLADSGSGVGDYSCHELYSVVATVFLGLLAIIPCIGLIGLLVINSAATSRLQLSGIKVGFLGANLSQF